MSGFRHSFLLQWRLMWRTGMIAAMLALSAAAVLVTPFFIRAVGADAVDELTVKTAMGIVFAVVTISMLVSSCAAFAQERVAKRLALTLVRPAHPLAVCLGKWCALVLAAWIIFLMAAVMLAATRMMNQCHYVVTGDVVQGGKSDSDEEYISIAPGKSADFQYLSPVDMDGEVVVRTSFTTDFGLRLPVRGECGFVDSTGGGYEMVAVTNLTGAIIEIPLEAHLRKANPPCVRFVNRGNENLMLRPRRDIQLLIKADSFMWNAFRAVLVATFMIASLIALGLFLSVSLGRPVALFTATILLTVAFLAPAALEQPIDAVNGNRVTRVGRMVSSFMSKAIGPIMEYEPMEVLSRGEQIEWRMICRAGIVDFVVIPFVFLLLSSVILPLRPPEEL